MRVAFRTGNWALAFALMLSLSAGAQPAGRGKRATEPPKPTFGFTGLEIYMLDWGVGQLHIADVNGDKLADIAVVNNKHAKIEFLLQRTAAQRRKAAGKVRVETDLNILPDDTRFEKKPYPVAKQIYSFTLGDLNSDSRPDIVFYGDPKELVVVYGDPKGAWGSKRTFRIADGATHANALAIGDFNGDKRNDLVLLGQSDTYFIYQDKNGLLKEPDKMPGPGSHVVGMAAADLNGDKRQDLLFLAPSQQAPLIVRLQDASGQMGPELAAAIPAPRFLEIKDYDGDGRAEIIYVEQRSGRLKVIRLAFSAGQEPDKAGEKRKLLRGQLRRHPLTKSVSSRARAMAIGDVNGDRRADVLVTDPRGAQIELHRQSAHGGLNRREVFPGLKGASALRIADLDKDGTVEILVLSSEERVIGVSHHQPSGRLSFPKPLPTRGEPLCFDVADLNADGRLDVAYVFSEKSKRSLHLLLAGPGGKFVPSKPISLKDCRTNPTGLRVADADQDGKPDLLVFIPYDALRIFTRDEKGEFVDRSRSETYRKGLVAKAEESAFSLGDVNGDGKPEILLAQKNLARAIILNAAGSIEIVDQFNGRSSTSQIAGVVALDLDGDRQDEIVLVDRTAKGLSVLKKQPSGMFKLVQNLHIGPFPFAGVFAEDIDGDGRGDIVLFGKHEFGVLYARAPDLRVEDVAAFETKIKDGRYQYVAVGDLNGDKATDLLLTETSKHFLEILTFTQPNTLVHGVQFKVFEGKSYAGKRYSRSHAFEPREAAVADVTGDGKADIVLLVHNRIIVYPQQ